MPDIGLRVVIAGVAESRRQLNSVQTSVDDLGRTIERVSGTSSDLGRTISAVGNSISNVGRNLTFGVTLPILAMGAAAITAGINFEDAFAGVGKTVEGISTATGELTAIGEQVREEFREIALEIPMSTVELANLGEVVGQLGVQAEDIVEVTEIVAQLGATTELSAEDAAKGLIRFGNILNELGENGENTADFLRSAGSAIVALGNASVSTEGEILELGLRLAAAGERANFSAQEILAWATTLSDLGVRAEAGGSAVSRAINEMLLAINTGSDNLATFAAAADTTVDAFVQAFEVDASGALATFIAKLKEGIEDGSVSIEMLNDMGLAGIRATDILGRLGNAEELFAKNLEIANKAWAEQVALQEEFNKRAATVKSQIQILKNAFTDLGITIFDLVKDDLIALIDGIKNLIKDFKNLDPSIQKAILQFALIAAAVGPVLIVVGGLITALGLFVSGLAAILSPAGLAAAAVVGLAGALAAVAIPNLIGLLGDLDSIKNAALEVGRALGFVVDVPTAEGAPVNATQADRAVEEGGTTPAFQVPTMDTFLQGLRDLAGADIENVMSSLDRIGASFGRIFETIAANPQTQVHLAGLAKSLGKIGDALKDFAIGALDSLAEFFEDNESNLAAAGSTLLVIADALGALLSGLVDVGAEIAGGGLDAFLNLISALNDLKSGDFEGALGNLKEALGGVVVAGLGAADGIKQAGQAVAEAFAGEELPTAAESWGGNLENLNAIMQQLSINAGTAMGFFVTSVTTGFNDAVIGAASFIGTMLATGTSFIQAAITGVGTGIGTLVSNVSGAFNSAVAAALGFVGAMGAAGAAFVQAAVNSVIDRGKALLNAASTAASTAATAFAGFAGAFAGAGAAFIQGAIAGINGLVGALVAAAVGAAQAAVGGFMGAFQVGSPSKVTMGIAEDVMAGLIVGINDNIKKLSSTASDAALGASESFASAFSPSAIMGELSLALSSTSAPASSITNNNNATNFNFGDISGVPMTSEDSLANLLRERLQFAGA